MTVDQAKAWAEERLDADEYEEIFGPVIEDGTTESLYIGSISSAAAARIRQEAIDREITIGQVVAEKFTK